MKYAIVFVLTNTSKYAYVCYHRIHAELRSYLLSGSTVFIILDRFELSMLKFLLKPI